MILRSCLAGAEAGTYMSRHEEAQGSCLGEEALVVDRVNHGVNLGVMSESASRQSQADL